MDHFLYTNVGGHEPNCDHAQVIEHDGQILIVLCDGLNGLPNGDQAAQIISDAALAALIEGKAPAESCITANSKFRELQFDNVELRRAGATICVVRIKNNHCEWANVGDSHIYHFSAGQLMHHSVDDTPTYRSFERGEIEYDAIREQDGRTGMTVCVGQRESIEPHEESFDLVHQYPTFNLFLGVIFHLMLPLCQTVVKVLSTIHILLQIGRKKQLLREKI